MDFTFKKYNLLINQLITDGYSFQTINEYVAHPDSKVVILRHDVEAKYRNALTFARIQSNLNIKGTYYFRILKNHFEKDIIEKIHNLGHEIGYHYDDFSACKGDFGLAIKRFEANLNIIREIGPVSTICMEGAPLSRYDNKELWTKYKYEDFGIKIEPYFNIDYKNILYLTDTGRSWSGRFCIRDKVNDISKVNNSYKFRFTNDLINASKRKFLPDKMILTFHPQRWNDRFSDWLSEYLTQNIKNQAKKIIAH